MLALFPELLRAGLAADGGANPSKFKRLRTSFELRGVFGPGKGVRLPQGRWAGLGVTLRKSAKLNCCPGVEIRDGSAACCAGGVDGRKSAICPFPPMFAGVGEFAR